MRQFAYTVNEHDPGRPWIIHGREHLTIELDEAASTSRGGGAVAARDRFTVELNPWQLDA